MPPIAPPAPRALSARTFVPPAFLALLALAGCVDVPKGATPIRPGDPHVLVIVLDGVRVDECTRDTVSDITGVTGPEWADDIWADLAPDATVVRSIVNPVLASTAPGHAALLMGRAEPIFTVGFQQALGSGIYHPMLPTIFEETRLQLGWAAEDTVFLANTVVPQNITESLYPGYEAVPGTWSAVYEQGSTTAIEQDDTRIVNLLKDSIEAGPPPLYVINLHDADRTGHDGEDAGYEERVAEQDVRVAELWRWLKQNKPGYLDGLLLVVTGDHGRHRHALDGGWTNHGDSCAGCREVPLFLAGEGVAEGAVEEGSYSLLDVAPTIAAHLGVDLPWAEGLPLSPLVGGVSGGRSGEIDVATSGGRVAARVWLDDFASRSEVRVDDEVVSTPGIFAAEAPSLLVGDATYVCFRELSLEPDAEDYLPWRPRCLVDQGSGWEEMGFPTDAVGPFWRPTLVEHDGALWASWLHTPLTRGAYGSDGVRLARWTAESGWSTEQGLGTYFTTTDVTMTPTASGFLVAAVENDGDPEEPYTRHAAVWTFDADGRDDGVERTFYLDELLSEPRRVERTALWADGDRVRLAMLAMDEDTRAVAVVESPDGGAAWGTPSLLPTEGELLVHLTPQWDDGAVVWGAMLDDGTAGLCRAVPGAAEAECVSTGSPRIDSFSVSAGVAAVSVDTGVGQWELGEVRW
jgi:hypothetical protein